METKMICSGKIGTACGIYTPDHWQWQWSAPWSLGGTRSCSKGQHSAQCGQSWPEQFGLSPSSPGRTPPYGKGFANLCLCFNLQRSSATFCEDRGRVSNWDRKRQAKGDRRQTDQRAKGQAGDWITFITQGQRLRQEHLLGKLSLI